MKKILIVIFLTGLGGILLSGCSSLNSSLEKEHVINNGCFITCDNNVGVKGLSSGGARQYVHFKNKIKNQQYHSGFNETLG
ncbi:hypothetical protein ACMCNP_02670 [Candidatus Acidulodesulfobacterium sp. H_13]|uniref:hypothetical protein n=1 Tax=Candidatus Acidulodesulfobacterium sp. H_13 TaxID=3395470 RepID=UPI003AF5E0ED